MNPNQAWGRLPPITNNQDVGPGVIGGPRLAQPLQAANVGYTNTGFDQQQQMGPQLAAMLPGYQKSMQDSLDRRMKSYDDQEGALSAYTNTLNEPNKNDMWGRFGASLLAPTRTGSFFEGFGNAANAAMDARQTYRDKEAERQERIYRSKMALAELQGNRPDPQAEQMNNMLKMYDVAGQVGAVQSGSDLQKSIANGTTPSTPEALLADAEKNPYKYNNPRGQQMVADAQAKLSKVSERQWELQKMQEQSRLKREEEAEKSRNRADTLTPSEEKMVSKSHSDVLAAQEGVDLLNRAEEIDKTGNVMGGRDPSWYASTGKWLADYVGQDWVPDKLFGSPEEQAATQEYYQIMNPASLERIKQNLPGPMTDKDLQFALGVFADPRATKEAREEARKTVRAKYQQMDNVGRSQLSRLLGEDGAKQLLGNADGKAPGSLSKQDGDTIKMAIEHAKANDAYGGVAAKLREMGYNISEEQLRSLTAEQIDDMIGE